MVHDLELRQPLKGMNAESVLTVMGPPDTFMDENCWTYEYRYNISHAWMREVYVIFGDNGPTVVLD